MIEVTATVLERYPNATFKVALEEDRHEIVPHISSEVGKKFIRILPGEKVLEEIFS